MKRKRCRISGSNSPAIVFCVPRNRSFPVSFRPSLAERAVKSLIAHPCTRTWRATAFRREPRQLGHSRASSSSIHSDSRSAANSVSRTESPSALAPVCKSRFQISPNPPHSSHAPCGELKENKRGSSSSNARPHPGQLISVLMTVSLRLLASSRRAVPRPISSAR